MEKFNFDEETQGYWKPGTPDEEKRSLSEAIANHEDGLGKDHEDEENIYTQDDVSKRKQELDIQRGGTMLTHIRLEDLGKESEAIARKQGNPAIVNVEKLQEEINALNKQKDALEKRELSTSEKDLSDFGMDTTLGKSISNQAIADLEKNIFDKKTELNNLISNN